MVGVNVRVDDLYLIFLTLYLMGRCIASDVFRVPVPSPVDFDYTLWYRLEKVRTMNSLVGKNLKHFHIEKLLDKGGMGVVYLGRDTRLDRPVAVKVLRQDLTANLDTRRGFLRQDLTANLDTRRGFIAVRPGDIQSWNSDYRKSQKRCSEQLMPGKSSKPLPEGIRS